MSSPQNNDYTKNAITNAFLSGVGGAWLDEGQAFEALAHLAHVRGYAEWATTKPLGFEPHKPTVEPPFPAITPAVVKASFYTFMETCIKRGWGTTDVTPDVWFGKKVQLAITSEPSEVVIHPNLVGIKLPLSLVEAVAKSIRTNLFADATVESMNRLLPGADDYERGYRDALHSVLLAAKEKGVSIDVIQDIMHTAFDGYANNHDREMTSPQFALDAMG